MKVDDKTLKCLIFYNMTLVKRFGDLKQTRSKSLKSIYFERPFLVVDAISLPFEHV